MSSLRGDMNKDDVKAELKEIIELVKVCPEPLQAKCFEILLTDYLTSKKQPTKQAGQTNERQDKPSHVPAETDTRIRAFAAQHGLQPDDVLKVFQVDDLGNVSIEVTDLKTNKNAKRQRTLALLIGGRHQFLEGAFEVPIEELRELCVTYSAYDAANFMTNLKNAKEIFAGFKSNATNKLSPVGKSELGKLIKTLASS